MPPFLLPEAPVTSLAEFRARGGGEGLRVARRFGPHATIEEVTAAGLRGRGGGGFQAGTKWASVRAAASGSTYVVANGAEGEPATFKDRTLMRLDPWSVVEGTAIAAFAVGARQAYIATKATFTAEVAGLERAAAALESAGDLDGLTITIVQGPDEYLYGEEKALLEVIEGHDPLPRLLPPWQHGLFATAPSTGWEGDRGAGRGAASNPTLVNNVETLATAAHILAKGAEWFRGMGTPRSPGTVLVTVVGDVVRAGVHEVEMGTPFAAVLERAGGPLPGHRFKLALSGVSNPVLVADAFDVPLTYEAFAALRTGLGAAGFVVYDERADAVTVARELSRFLAVESCGQCPACKGGSDRITQHLLAVEEGRGSDDDVERVGAELRQVTDGARCFLAQEEQQVVSSLLFAFSEDFARRLEGTGPPLRALLVPKIVDIGADGTVVYDERHALKLPDWTYAR